MSTVPQKRKHEEESVSAEKSDKVDLEAMKANLSHAKWVKRIAEAVKGDSRQKAEETFEQYLDIFRNDGKVWTQYIGYEMDHPDEAAAGEAGEAAVDAHKKKVEALFAKCLAKIYDVSLWRLYLRYVQRNNDATAEGTGELARSTVLKAFNFSADHVGMDFLHSQDLWNDYIRYLNEWKPANANEAQTRVDLTRQVMVRMIQTPSVQLEENWKRYITFETETDQANARKNINDRSPEFMKLRPLNQELLAITQPLKETNERRHSKRQLNRFSRWIHWEASNKLELPDDKAKQRLDYVQKLSTQFERFQPEVWFNYAAYLMSEKRHEDALQAMKDGLILNPESITLTQQLSGYYERDSDKESAQKTWEQLIRYHTAEYEKAKSGGKDVAHDFSRVVSTCYSLYMKQMKRVGTIKDVRTTFSHARKFKGLVWQTFVDYALIEYQANELRVAVRSFEFGMRFFGKEYGFVSAYLDFLISIKDMTNCKKVVEVALENFKQDPESSYRLFCRYMKIELEYGDSNSIKTLETRFVERFPEMTPFDLTVVGFESDVDQFNAAKLTDQYADPRANVLKEKPRLQQAEEEKKDPINMDVGGRGKTRDASPASASPAARKKPFVVRDEMYNLLRVLPRAEYYTKEMQVFDAEKVVEFFGKPS